MWILVANCHSVCLKSIQLICIGSLIKLFGKAIALFITLGFRVNSIRSQSRQYWRCILSKCKFATWGLEYRRIFPSAWSSRARRVCSAVWISVIPIWISRNPREREWNRNTRPPCKAYCIYFSCRNLCTTGRKSELNPRLVSKLCDVEYKITPTWLLYALSAWRARARELTVFS